MTVSVIAEITKEFRFEAAHFLPNVPEQHQCHNIHGHSYLVILRVLGPIDEKFGWVMDLNDLANAFKPLLKELDHSLLNNIKGLENPTGENVAIWIMIRLGRIMPTLDSVTVHATNRIAVTIKRQDVDFLIDNELKRPD